MLHLFPERLNEIFTFVFVHHDANNLLEEVTPGDFAAIRTVIKQGRMLGCIHKCQTLSLIIVKIFE